ncbi:unnamed protein product [Fraxinus pennsylvanica]|uniref:Leucine-rich repeat-containing N-terminal plant-type domain-containing protein n=1 Tax=Fraxinus pennsylvanica TaxID=56036 RepID=A0AAD1YLR5_9LAMI|nr:unnamed protein product [Fraxinus pennsylvanica]
MLLIVVVVALSCSVYTCHGSCNLLDRDSLSLFNLSISTPYPSNWSLSADCCSWEGVGCDDSDRVNSLLLPSKGLAGTISPLIVNLSHVTELNLSRNWLSGPILDGFFTALNCLVIIDLSNNRLSGNLSDSNKLMNTVTTVDLSSNRFYGTIQPSFLQPALNLQRFDVSNSSFSGPIPSSLRRFSLQSIILISPTMTLEIQRADFNNLSGHIPSDIYKVSALQELYFPANKLSGKMDGSIDNLVNLRTLALYGNEFTGKIPQDIGSLSSLEHLLLHINQLNGTLPQSLIKCTRLTMLHLRLNFLEGELSSFDFSKFIKLISIDLGNNFFTGRLPATLFSCKNLTYIRLATNSINGEILPDIMALQSLSFLYLSNSSLNNVTSAIRFLTGCKNLSTLDLSKNFHSESLPDNENLPNGASILQYNDLSYLPPAIYLGSYRISGTIPIDIGQLKFIVVLNLSNNNFSGSIPDSISNLTNLEKLELSGNHLSGEIPASFKNLNFLSFFSAAYNNLQGRIPVGGQFDHFQVQALKEIQGCAVEFWSGHAHPHEQLREEKTRKRK